MRDERLAGLLARRRGELGLSLREAARRMEISPAYLVALERGRNPTTGRPPNPSPPVLAAIGRALGIEMGDLLVLAGAPAAPSGHVLLYRMGDGARPALDVAREACAGRADTWIELAGIRAPAGIADALAPARGDGRVALLFARGSHALLTAADPAAVLARERTWEDDISAVCRRELGAAPAANVCVYNAADLRALRARLDQIAALLDLVRAHPHVVAEDAGGAVSTGRRAIEMILTAARPAAIGAATWGSLAAAAAHGLAQRAAWREGA